MKLILATLLALSSLLVIESARLKNCKGWPAFKKKSVSSCDAKNEVCPFKRGTNVTLAGTFAATENADNVTFQVWGKLQGTTVKVPFPIEPNNACKWGVNCPVKKGEQYDFKISVFVERIFPKTKVDVGFEMIANNKTRIGCTQFPVQIT